MVGPFKIALLNLLIFFILILSIESFFTLNDKYKIFNSAFLSVFHSQSPEDSNSFLSNEEVLKKYNLSSTRVPDYYQSQDAYPVYDGTAWQKISSKYEEINNTDYGVRLRGGLNRNKDFIVTNFISKDGNQKVLYKVSYNFDENGLRRTTRKKTTVNPTQVLAIGDSFTFGEGVTADRNYPYQLDLKLNSDFKVSNFGFHGYSINDLLYEIRQNPSLFSHVHDKPSIAIWLFISPHLERAFCHARCFAQSEYIRHKPRFISQDGQLIMDGTFANSSSIEMKTRRFFAKSSTLDFFNIDYPLNYSDSELKLFVDMFIAVRSFLQKETHLQDFYFVNYYPFRERKRLLSLFRQAGFKVLDYSDINFNYVFDNQKIPYDGHPTSEAYWVLTELLMKDIFTQSDRHK